MSIIAQQIKALVDELGLTPYGISLAVSAETDPSAAERKRIEKRWQRWIKGEGLKTLADLENDLKVLGYELRIVKLTK